MYVILNKKHHISKYLKTFTYIRTLVGVLVLRLVKVVGVFKGTRWLNISRREGWTLRPLVTTEEAVISKRKSYCNMLYMSNFSLKV